MTHGMAAGGRVSAAPGRRASAWPRAAQGMGLADEEVALAARAIRAGLPCLRLMAIAPPPDARARAPHDLYDIFADIFNMLQARAWPGAPRSPRPRRPRAPRRCAPARAALRSPGRCTAGWAAPPQARADRGGVAASGRLSGARGAPGPARRAGGLGAQHAAAGGGRAGGRAAAAPGGRAGGQPERGPAVRAGAARLSRGRAAAHAAGRRVAGAPRPPGAPAPCMRTSSDRVLVGMRASLVRRRVRVADAPGA